MKKNINKTLTNTGTIGSIATIAVCPLCVPLFAGIFSALGLGALIPLWQPIVGIFLLIGLFGFIYSFRIHHKLLPLILFIIGGSLLYIGRYLFGGNPVWIIGSIFMIGAIYTNYRAGKKIKCK